MLVNFLWVAAGGSIGAMLRYAISLASIHWWGDAFPWGTLLANLAGCLIMGMVMGIGLHKEFETHYLLLGVGVLGALTTFSTFSAESLQLAMDGHWMASGLNILGNVAGCLLACFAGLVLSRWVVGS